VEDELDPPDAGALAALAPEPALTCTVEESCELAALDVCPPDAEPPVEPPEPPVEPPIEPPVEPPEAGDPDAGGGGLCAPPLGLALAPPELVVVCEPCAPADERSAATWACVLLDVATLRVVMAVWTLVELHARPCGCSLRILLISPSIFVPPPIGPGG
jgi:hypothetical protein